MAGFYPTILECPELGPDIYLSNGAGTRTRNQNVVLGLPCSCCGKRSAVRRCRFCRAIGYCSSACASSHATCHRKTHSLRFIVMKQLSAAGAEGGDCDLDFATHFEPISL